MSFTVWKHLLSRANVHSDKVTQKRSLAYFFCPGVKMSKHAEMFVHLGLLVITMALMFYILTHS